MEKYSIDGRVVPTINGFSKGIEYGALDSFDNAGTDTSGWWNPDHAARMLAKGLHDTKYLNGNGEDFVTATASNSMVEQALEYKKQSDEAYQDKHSYTFEELKNLPEGTKKAILDVRVKDSVEHLKDWAKETGYVGRGFSADGNYRKKHSDLLLFDKTNDSGKLGEKDSTLNEIDKKAKEGLADNTGVVTNKSFISGVIDDTAKHNASIQKFSEASKNLRDASRILMDYAKSSGPDDYKQRKLTDARVAIQSAKNALIYPSHNGNHIVFVDNKGVATPLIKAYQKNVENMEKYYNELLGMSKRGSI